MTTLVTVPGGATGTPVATFTFQDTNTTGIGVAKSIATALAGAVGNKTLSVASVFGSSSVASTVLGGTTEVYVRPNENPQNIATVGTGWGFIVNDSRSKATITASANAQVISNIFGGVFNSSGAATLVAAGGDNNVSQTGAGTVFLSTGEGNDTIAAAGAGTIAGGTGHNFITLNGNGQLVLSRGNDAITIGSGAGSNNDTIDVSAAANTTIFGSTGNIRFVSTGVSELWIGGADANAPDTIAATSTGDSSVIADPIRGLLFRAASGGKATVATGAPGGAGTTVFGATSSNINVTGGAGNANNPVFVVAGDGNSTLNASASTGPVWLSVNTSVPGAAGVILTGGSGNDFLVIGGAPGTGTLTGGAGSDSFVFFKQASGQGANIVTDFNRNQDAVFIEGYGIQQGAQRDALLANAVASGGNLTLNLGDGTTITFLNTARDQLPGRVHTS